MGMFRTTWAAGLCAAVAALAIPGVALAKDGPPPAVLNCDGLDAVSLATCQVMIAFEEMAFDRRQPKQAMETYAAEDFIDHNPNIKGDRASVIQHLSRLDWSTGGPQREVVHFVVRGEIAMVHHQLKRKPGDRGIAVVDIFRVKNGKLAEHWDVLQPIPENSVNPKPMF